MQPITTELEPHLQNAVDNGISGLDIIHGELKNLMLEVEEQLTPLLDNIEELGSDEEYADTVDRLTLTGYMDALSDIYALTYKLSFAIAEREKQ